MPPRSALEELLGVDLVDRTMAPIKHLALAKSRPEVRALSERAGLDLIGYNWPLIHDWNDPRKFTGLAPVVNRLVQTGLDTPENLELLFGSADAVASIHQELRWVGGCTGPAVRAGCALGQRSQCRVRQAASKASTQGRCQGGALASMHASASVQTHCFT